MKIAIASGKGGTGKTLIATNLAYRAAQNGHVLLYDLDVEEPNDHLFFNTTQKKHRTVNRMIPEVDEESCTHCGHCSDICEYNAIISLAEQVMVFPELCHSCYACLELCPENAISEGIKEIGELSLLDTQQFPLVSGKLKISETATTALISSTKSMEINSDQDLLSIYDAPPGSSCPLIEAVKDMDYVILVGEPTPFGIHDLDLVAQTLRVLRMPFGVIINKNIPGNTMLHRYCSKKNIDIIGEIPHDMHIARSYAKGELISKVFPVFGELFQRLLNKIYWEIRA